MGYTCKNYRAAGTAYSGHSQGMVLADLYHENGNVYRTAAPVADCGSYLAATAYANQKNNELKAAAAAALLQEEAYGRPEADSSGDNAVWGNEHDGDLPSDGVDREEQQGSSGDDTRCAYTGEESAAVSDVQPGDT